MRKSIQGVFLVSMLAAGGCTWVHMEPGASAVRVIDGGGAPAGCQKRGELEVTVMNNVAFYERNQLRVREELETQARNGAEGLKADTVQPLGEPVNGTQRFAAWSCGGGARGASVAQPPRNSAVQTYPAGG
ncbi:DUF4156 domain-containing protein [Lysobacter stagni]|uniref:DUF4156 domain-containing protein n=1 Tax=Lysobacter stagni TaxID=3045172 RepID=UPI003D77F972